MTEIYVDADACPVKDEVLRVAERHRLRVHMVSNQGYNPRGHALVNPVMVPPTPDAADDWIAEHIGAGDVAVTADIPLADRCVKAGAAVLGPTGKPFTAENIGAVLATRDLMAHLRETGEIRGGGRAMDRRDKSRFLEALESAVRCATGKAGG